MPVLYPSTDMPLAAPVNADALTLVSPYLPSPAVVFPTQALQSSVTENISAVNEDDDEDDDEDEKEIDDAGFGTETEDGGFKDGLDDDEDLDEFDDIDEDDFDDDFDDDFEEELEDDYEIEIDDEISTEFGLNTAGKGKEEDDAEEEIDDELDDFDDFENID
jgi:hypothetical protein